MITFIGVIGVVFGCRETQDPSPTFPTPAAEEGRVLAEQHCSACHLPVPPSYLDQRTWLNSVLPAMAPKMGINVLWDNQYYQDQDAASEATVSLSDWMKIVAYFEAEAPDTLPLPDPPPSLRDDLPMFTVEEPRWEPTHRPPATAMVAIDPSTREIYTSDITTARIYRWDENMEPTVVRRSDFLGVSAYFVTDEAGERHGVFTSIGTMGGTDVANGEVWEINLGDGSSRLLAENLHRPVCALPGDFNKNGLQDWIVCGFGFREGGLYMLEQQPDRTFEKKTLRDVPGAVDAQVGDFNDNGWLDVMVLFGQGDEGIWLFENDQNGGFESRAVMRFPAVYGSTGFQLVDFNNNGRLDLLYVSGDNADYSAIPKPYHGVYLFLNQGDFDYEQAYFYPLSGATKAIAADFNGDGMVDISAIAFFADLEKETANNFVYLEQVEPLVFTPYAPPLYEYGRWRSMDVGDVTGDERLDLVLGNFPRHHFDEEGSGSGSYAYAPFIILKNDT